MTIILPLPGRILSPNASRHIHWGTKSKAIKKARGEAKFLAALAIREAGWKSAPAWKSATVKARFYFRTNRRRDADGLIGSLKAAMDGLTDAGVWDDDSGVTWLPPEVFIDVKSPRVEIEVEES